MLLILEPYIFTKECRYQYARIYVMKTKMLLKYANLYYLYANADLRTNMVLRILHSLIPQIVHNDDPAKYQEYLAEQLIPGAKEVLQYGIQAIASEYRVIKLDDEANVLTALISDPINGLKMAATGFRSKRISGYGGEPWARFAEALIVLKEKTDRAEKTRNPKDAQALTVNLNQIDGMMHNTGDFLEKMVQQEGGYMTVDKQEELRRLRNITRLPAEHSIPLMESEARKLREADFYEELFKQHRGLHPVQEGDYEKAKQSLEDFSKERLTEMPSEYKFTPKAPPPPPPPKKVNPNVG